MENITLTKEITFTTEENDCGDVLHFVWNGSCTVNVHRGQMNRGVIDLYPYPLDTFTIYGDEGGAAAEADVVASIREWLADRAEEEQE